jgi:hypothetical protein
MSPSYDDFTPAQQGEVVVVRNGFGPHGRTGFSENGMASRFERDLKAAKCTRCRFGNLLAEPKSWAS